MSKIRKKDGFTLVECVVAMAVLAIMSLMLLTLLSIAINIRNRNMKTETEIDGQIADLAQQTGDIKEKYDSDIVLKDGSGNEIKIPGNSAEGVSAGKVYHDGYDSELGKLEYNFDDYFAAVGTAGVDEDPDNDLNSKPTVDTSTGGKVGENNISSTIIAPTGMTISETKSEYKEAGVNFWKVCWTVQGQTELAYDKAVKIILPIGAEFDKSSATAYQQTGGTITGNCKIYDISKYCIAIRPSDGSDVAISNLSITAPISFKISQEDYNTYVKDIGSYFTGTATAGNTITIQ